ncbi:MAG: penicillin-binding transpeptidase domain-containing protein [Planctomycetota bacterium]|nr:penicillin-binding transpeptidase domain-containing protein [Planctomycetota bacterium]
MYATRLKLLLVVLGLGLALVLVSLLRIQILQGARYREEAERRLKHRPHYRPTIRGTVYDRNGVALARDTGAYDVAVYFPFIEMDAGFLLRLARRWDCETEAVHARVARMWEELSRLTGIPPDELARRCEVIRRRVEVIRRTVRDLHGRRIRVAEETYFSRGSIPHSIVYDVDLRTVGVIKSRPEQFPGLVLEPTRRREYPLGDVAPHVVGRLGEVTADELSGGINAPYPQGHLKRYWPGDRTGRAGVERACESILRGTRGVYQKAIDGAYLENIDPAAGRDVHLTLDVALQSDVEDLLDHGPKGRVVGAAVVLDCATGEVLALASAPRYDVRLFGVDYPDLVRRTDKPLVHRALAGQYPLGSVFKAVTATCALHEGAITPRTFLTCDGVLDPSHPDRFRCHIFLKHGYGHGTIPLRTAIQKSCNVYFYRVALRLSALGGRLDLGRGRDLLVAWARRMGLGAKTGIGLPGEATGRLDVRDPRNLAVGQGELLVTPLQAAQLYGLVASAGRMPPLRLVREKAPPPGAPRPGLHLNPSHMRFLRDAFAAVVNEPGGTGYRHVRCPEVRIAGKTGTAEAGRGEDHAWFAGFAPAEAPRVAFAVIVEHGGHGGVMAGPVARDLVLACKAHGYLEPSEVATDAGPTPSTPTAGPEEGPEGKKEQPAPVG